MYNDDDDDGGGGGGGYSDGDGDSKDDNVNFDYSYQNDDNDDDNDNDDNCSCDGMIWTGLQARNLDIVHGLHNCLCHFDYFRKHCFCQTTHNGPILFKHKYHT